MISLDDVISAARSHQVDLQRDPTLVEHLFKDKGWPVQRIAQHTGLGRTTIYRRLEKAGLIQQRARRKTDRQTYVDLYAQGLQIPEIAAKTGRAYSTVRYNLVEAGVYQPRPPEVYRNRNPQKDVCSHGHDMKKWGRHKKGRPPGTRECVRCLRDRQREYAARKYAERKKARAQEAPGEARNQG